METDTRVIGFLTRPMDMGNISTKMEQFSKENFATIDRKEKGENFGEMVVFTSEISRIP
jgi:hypothetical protein